MQITRAKIKRLILTLPLLILFYNCNTKSVNVNEEFLESVSDTSSLIIKYDKSLFSVPSPYQIAVFLDKTGVSLNKEILNETEKSSKYVTNFDKALNIGVYGTDLVYLNMYGQTQDILTYFSTIKNLSKDLDIISIIDSRLMKMVENNLENKDSLLFIISKMYVNTNHYLKLNERNETSALIIVGGWIESFYILTQSIQGSKSRELVKKVAEQKHPLDNIIEMLSPYYYRSEKFSKLVDSFVDLAYEFDGVIFNYTYQKPTIYEDKKLTMINGKSNVIISDYQLRTISNKISWIRNAISQ